MFRVGCFLPEIAVYPLLEGFGLADVERRVLFELAEGAGARKAYVWEGRELTDDELRQGKYGTP